MSAPTARIRDLEAALAEARRALGHDVGGRLRNIAVLAELARGGAGCDAEAAECVTRIAACAVEAREIVGSLERYLSAWGPPEPRAPVGVAASLSSAAGDGGAALSVEGEALAMAEPAGLSHAFAELIDNAVRRGGARRVAARVAARPDGVDVRLMDDGAGVPPAQAERIFAAFERLAPVGADQRPGLGLGLAISRRLIERMGGRVAWAAPAPGDLGGAAFEITLPAAGAASVTG